MREVVVVLGGTGTIGQHLVPRLCTLLAASSAEQGGERHVVRVVSRDVEKANKMFAPLGFFASSNVEEGGEGDPSRKVEVQVVQGDVGEVSSLQPALHGATRLFLLTLTSLMHRQVAVERDILNLLALDQEDSNASTVRHIVRLSAHSRGMEGQPSNSPFRWHSECDEQLLRYCDRDLACTRDVAVTILRPSLFMQDMTRRHFAPLICKQNVFFQLGSAPEEGEGDYEDSYKIAMVDARDIADVAACSLSESVEKHDHNTYILSGPKALSWGDVAAAISNVCNRSIKSVMLNDMSFFNQFGGSHVYLKQMQAYRSGCGADVDGDIEVVTGHAARSLEKFCHDHAEAWQKE